MDTIKILAFILMAIGAFITYGARIIVDRMNLAQTIGTKEAEDFSGEELEKYKMTKAIARVKTIGFLILLPGVILIFIAYR